MPEVPAVPGARALGARVDRIFDPETGALRGALDGFEARSGQRQLARAVADTFDTGGTLLAEAGTGIGKTLAYLIPAVLSGERVLISTGTRNLQDQIFYKDVPAVGQVLGRPVRAAYMKGRTNYLCLHRFERLVEASSALPASDQRWLARVNEWAAESATGDRAEIDDLPDDLPLWSELSATTDQCLGRDCPAYDRCFVTRMRERAAEAELVIVNHHLLAADASIRQDAFGEVIPECNLLVVDEAHQLEDVVTQYFGVALGTHRVDQFAKDAATVASSLPQESLRLSLDLSDASVHLQRRARQMFEVLRDEVDRRRAGDRLTFTAEVATAIDETRREVAEALARIVRFEDGGGVPEDVTALVARAAAMRSDLDTLTAADDPRYVHFVEVRGRSVTLKASPIDASAIVRDVVIGTRRAVVLTSATLTVQGDFAYARGRLGLDGADTLRVPSEFDFRRQALLYLPEGLPDPRSREFNRTAVDVIVDILACSEGRAFVLFTSYAALREVHEHLAPRVPWPLLVQGTSPRSTLIRDFRATPNAVLLATSSFWQGVDVVGEALSAVIIDRLPFASPGDPLVAARIAAVTAQGRHAFHDYQVPLATLTLLQGIGRLIRSRSDRGLVSVLDPRLTRMPYGRRFLGSLPPAPITGDLAEVRRFFEGGGGDGQGGGPPERPGGSV